jgi:PKHD-type hydroxylase
MIFPIQDVLTSTEVIEIATSLADAQFVDGKLTAGWHAKSVKHNTQLAAKHPVAEMLQTIIAQALQQNPLFQAAVRPKVVRPMLFNCYDVGMSYGRHTDNALMPIANGLMRSDVSMTVFLSDPEQYDGGELVLETSLGEQVFKLSAGSAIVYPSTTLHEVRPVTRGKRFAAITWIQSLVRDPAHREILFDLDTARQVMFKRQGKTPEFDLISKSLSNLLREWSEV